MTVFYAQRSPTQSTTSLSGDEDDDLNRSVFFPPTSPATWSSRLHTISSGVTIPSHSPASNLPPELLINILKYLTSPNDIHSTLLVSRSWCECSVELLWHKPSLPDFRSLMKIIHALSRPDASFSYGHFIRRLNFLAVAKDISDSVISRLYSCIRLERLTLVGCNNLSDDILSQTLPNFKELVAIDLSGVTSITDFTVFALADNCPKLQGVNLLDCKHVTSRGISALAHKCPLLRRVKLSGIVDLTNEPISALALHAPLVLEIDLGGCKHITDPPVRDVWLHSKCMREMRLANCTKLTDSAFPAPPHVKNDNHSSLDPNKRDLPPLRLNRVFDQLRMLDLTGCDKITDDAIEGIVLAAPKLRNLALTKCKSLTDRAVEAICALGKNLHYIHLGHVSNITDRAVKSLARACTRLRYIDLANCHQLSDMSVFEIANLPKLRRVGLVRVPNLTDEAIYTLGEHNSSLERIHLSYCDQLTVMAIHFLLQKMHKLSHLSLTGVPSFRKPELQHFCRSPPPGFNTPQRQAFCVYSGDGVKELRHFLTELFNSINDDMRDSEYDDDGFDDDAYPSRLQDHYMDDDTLDIDEDMAHPSLQIPIVPLHPMVRSENTQRVPRSATSTSAAMPTVQSVQPRHPPQSQTAAGPSRWSIPFLRANDQPRAVPSPTPSDGSALSQGAFFRTFTLDDGTHVDGSTLRHGALTPDLVFAEIGHGRGISIPPTHPHLHSHSPMHSQMHAHVYPNNVPSFWVDNSGGPATAPVNGSFTGRTNGYALAHHHYHHLQPLDDREHPNSSNQTYSILMARGGSGRAVSNANGGSHTPNGNNAFPSNGISSHNHNGNGHGSHHTTYNVASHNLSSSSQRFSAPPNGVLVSGQQANGADRGRSQGTKPLHDAVPLDTSAGPSGRTGVKRVLRNTFNAVEHHASSFLFGRATHEDLSSREQSRTR